MINLPHTLLPPLAIQVLQAAAKVEPTPEDPLARVKAIEAATQRVKRHYPKYFIQENHHDCETD